MLFAQDRGFDRAPGICLFHTLTCALSSVSRDPRQPLGETAALPELKGLLASQGRLRKCVRHTP